jgi:3-deoxy-D-manno-octulosonic-acid transferase
MFLPEENIKTACAMCASLGYQMDVTKFCVPSCRNVTLCSTEESKYEVTITLFNKLKKRQQLTLIS